MVKGPQIEKRLTQANPVPRPEHLHDDPAEAAALLALITERRDDMTTTKQAPTRPERSSRWRPALVASAAGILVLMVVGAAALISFTGSDSEVAGPATTIATTTPAVETTLPAAPTTTPPVATTVPAPEPSSGLLAGTWAHETSATEFAGGGSAVETSLGLIATDSRQGVLVSEDGIDWRLAVPFPEGELIEDAELLPGEPPLYTVDAMVISVVEFDGKIYVFSFIAEDAHSPAMTFRRVVYSSSDGMSWEETTYSTQHGGEMTVAGENEILVVAEQEVVIRSEDGVTWIAHDPGLVIESILFAGDRYLAVTVDDSAECYEWGKRSMIESVDGIEWAPIPGSDFAYDDFPRDPVMFDGRIYMSGLYFGEDTWQHGMVFVSEDGSEWERAAVPNLAELRFVTDLIPSDDGLLALGAAMWSEDPESVARIVPMTTLDGTTFFEVPHPAGLFDRAPEAWGYTMGDQIVIRGLEYEPVVFHEWIWSPAD
ncbi:MAG: hypothetical protein ACR2OI_01175 [Acidimicrobiia bacterium]